MYDSWGGVTLTSRSPPQLSYLDSYRHESKTGRAMGAPGVCRKQIAGTSRSSDTTLSPWTQTRYVRALTAKGRRQMVEDPSRPSDIAEAVAQQVRGCSGEL